jgi:hypothetical protein
VEVSARIGDQNFEQRIELGAITIVPAGLSMHWQQEGSASIHALQLYLDPNFLRTIAGQGLFAYRQAGQQQLLQIRMLREVILIIN